MKRSKGWLVCIAVFASMVMGGCYRYEPIDRPAPMTAVRVLIPITSAIDNPNAPARTVAIEGIVISWGDTLVLATETRNQLNQFRELVQYDTTKLAAGAYSGMQSKEFATGKSIALGVAVFGGVAVLATYVFNGGSKNTIPNTPGGGPTPAIVFSGSLLSSIWGLLPIG